MDTQDLRDNFKSTAPDVPARAAMGMSDAARLTMIAAELRADGHDLAAARMEGAALLAQGWHR